MNHERIENVKSAGRWQWARSLKPLKQTKIFDGHIIGLDSEYDSRTRKFICWTLYYRNKGILITQRGLRDVVRAAENLLGEEKGTRPIAFITYFSLAELQHMPTFAKAGRFFTGGRGSLDAEFEVLGRRVLVFDIARFFEGSRLADVAKTFGMRKGKWDTTRVTKSCLRSKRFRAYAIRDARIVYKVAEDLRRLAMSEGVDLIEAKTPAGLASQIFRYGHLREEIEAPPTRVRNLALKSLWGGRAEAFYRGSILENVFEYDLVSAYPNAAIRLGALPRGQDWKEMSYGSGIGGFSRGRFSFPEGTRYPCLPVFADNRLLFPTMGESYCTFHEWRLARSLGADIEILESYGYERGNPDLGNYLKRVLEERKCAAGARKILLKLQANSLIGKFSQSKKTLSVEQIREFARLSKVSMYDVAGLSHEDREGLGLEGQVNLGGAWYPEWNALITGYVRAQIGSLAQQHSALYISTDAIWTQAPIPTPPDESYTLKRVGPCTIARSRLAAIWGLTKKGDHVIYHSFHSKDAARDILLDFEQGKDLSIEYQHRRALKPKETLRLRMPLGTWVDEDDRLGTTAWDGKRRVLVDGTTRPWESVAEYFAWKKTVDVGN